MLNSDYIIDIGPKAGLFGGQIVSTGTVKDTLTKDTTTALYLSNKKKIFKEQNPITMILEIKNANLHNLKNISIKVPKNVLVAVVGAKWSWKSLLMEF